MTEDNINEEMERVLELSNNILSTCNEYSLDDIEMALSFALMTMFWDTLPREQAVERSQAFIAKFLYLSVKHDENIASDMYVLQ